MQLITDPYLQNHITKNTILSLFYVNPMPQKEFFLLENYFSVKEFYIIEILIVSYPNDVIVILISNCLIEIMSIKVFFTYEYFEE